MSASFGRASYPTVVFQDDFGDEAVNATPYGWSTNRNDATYMFFRVNGDSDGFTTPLLVSDNQGGSLLYGQTPIGTSVTNGNLSFTFSLRPVSSGSSTHELHVVLRDKNGNNVIVLKMLHYWSSAYFTLGLQNTEGEKHYTESTLHIITVKFQNKSLSLVVDNVTEMSNISYNGGLVTTLRIESTAETYGGTHFFDNFKVFSDNDGSNIPPNIPPPQPTPPNYFLIFATIAIVVVIIYIVVSVTLTQRREHERKEPGPILRSPTQNMLFNYSGAQFCPGCGRRTLKDSNFCHSCGESLR